MTTLISPPPIQPVTLADLLSRLGDIPPSRVRLHPFPGTATEKDVTFIADHENVTCELIEGTLVEKAMGLRESLLAMLLVQYLGTYVRTNKLGFLTGPDGTMKLFSGLIRAPDVAFISVNRMPGDRVRNEAIPHVVPDLAVDVLSESNTAAEMRRKRNEYFEAGVKLVWIIDLDKRAATVFTSPEQFTVISEDGSLEGGAVVPGFTLSLRQLFADLEEAYDARAARP